MKVLVTGICGFVGKELSRAFLSAGHEICGFDLQTTDTDSYSIHKCDVRDTSGVANIFKKERPDACIHLAAIAHTDISPADEDRVREINVKAAESVGRIAAEQKTRRFLYFSSAKVLGDQTGPEGIDEGQEPNPGSIYGKLKLEAEQRLRKVAEDSGIELCIVRPVAVFGPGDSRGNYAKLLGAIRRGFFPVIGGGRARRSISFLPRLAEKVVRIVTGPSFAPTPMVLSDGDYRVMEIMEAIRAQTGFAVFPRIPEPFAKTMALAVDAGLRVLGKKTKPASKALTRLTDNFVVKAHRYDEKYGAFPPLDLNQAFRETVSFSLSRKRLS